MSSVEDHYQRLLAENYTWMSGGHERQVAKSRDDLTAAGFVPRPGAKALDLGCGSGYQSFALTDLGYVVTAVDNSGTLLEELNAAAAGRPVTTVLADMRDAGAYIEHGPFDVAVCMGDTLIHLQSELEVAALFADVFACLLDGGRFALSFRDLSREFTGVDRILPVRMDDRRLMAVFLEYGEHHVTVNDVLFIRDNDGWAMNKSAYRKLRLPPHRATDLLRRAGFHDVTTTTDRWGFTNVTARK